MDPALVHYQWSGYAFWTKSTKSPQTRGTTLNNAGILGKKPESLKKDLITVYKVQFLFLDIQNI